MSDGDRGYPLDLLSPVRHVATALDRAAPAALSVAEMAADYNHPNPGDISRVRRAEDCPDTTDGATIWLMQRAVDLLTYRTRSSRSKRQIEGNGHGYRLVVPFAELRYEGERLVETVSEDEQDADRKLRAIYNDLNADRPFYVKVQGARGSSKEVRLSLHPLARAIPKVTKKEFDTLTDNVKARGVRNTILLYDGQVLDGRHRVAIASVLDLPIRTAEFTGSEEDAWQEVLSQNVLRRHLTPAQYAHFVAKQYLPEAKAKAELRKVAGQVTGGRIRQGSASLPVGREADLTGEAIQNAVKKAKEAGVPTSARSVSRILPVLDAPETEEKVLSGEIKAVATAEKAARKEIAERGGTAGETPAVTGPISAYSYLKRAIIQLEGARDALQRGHVGTHVGGGHGDVKPQDLLNRVAEIRAVLDDVVTAIADQGR